MQDFCNYFIIKGHLTIQHSSLRYYQAFVAIVRNLRWEELTHLQVFYGNNGLIIKTTWLGRT